MEAVQHFDELTTDRQALAGGKGGALARLYQLGFPVPEGFVVLPSAFQGDELMPAAWKQAQTQLRRLRRESADVAFAVRSSALAEDSDQASFAGEFETVLNLSREEQIRDAILTVRHSRLSERVQAYSQAKGIKTDHEIGIVVQKMVQAEFSGVLFTVDPISGSRETMNGNFVSGLGDKLVSGQATGKSFAIERPGGKYQGPAEIRPYADQLFRLALDVEEASGHPQDIEWAIGRGRLFLLQSRPITTLTGPSFVAPEWNDSLNGDYLWSNVNFGEAVTEVMTPLSWTVLHLIFGEYVILPGYDAVGNIGGRPYLNISHFASLLQAIGKSRKEILETMEGTLYMKLPEEITIPTVPLSRWQLITSLPAFLRTRYRERKGLRNLAAYLAENPAWFRRTRRRLQAITTRRKLALLWDDEIKPHVTGSLWNVMGSMSASTALSMDLRRELQALVGQDDAHVLLSNLSGTVSGGVTDGKGMLASLGPMVGVARLASGQIDRETYLEEYGHRGPHEFELSVPRPAEDPGWVDENLRRFKESPVDIEAMLARQRAAFEAAWDRLEADHPRKAKVLKPRLTKAARLARLRESARSEYIRDRWIVRLFGLRAGEVTGLGDDIFFLTIDEVQDVLRGDDSALSSVPARKDAYQLYKALPNYPSIIRGRFDPVQWAADPNRRTDFYDGLGLSMSAIQEGQPGIITGSPGSAGRVEAAVRRLDRPEDGDQLQKGEVLVTAQTDIAWTLLFPRAAAVVTDVGAPLSHAAIVARELGIPAVVGCGDATMRLATGDRVRVDGGQGMIEILSD